MVLSRGEHLQKTPSDRTIPAAGIRPSPLFREGPFVITFVDFNVHPTGMILLPLVLCQPWSPRDTWREPRGGRERAACGWFLVPELGRAPGTQGAHGKQAELQRDRSAQEQLLSQPSRAGAVPAGTQGQERSERGQRQRAPRGC